MHTFYLAMLYLLLSLFSVIFPMCMYKISMLHLHMNLYMYICVRTQREVSLEEFRYTFNIWKDLHTSYFYTLFFTDMAIPEKWQCTEDPQSILNTRSIQYQCTKFSISVLKQILRDFHILTYLFLSRPD